MSAAARVSDLLATRPGVQLTRTFSGTQLMLQGLDPQYVLIRVDGKRAIGRILPTGRSTSRALSPMRSSARRCSCTAALIEGVFHVPVTVLTHGADGS